MTRKLVLGIAVLLVGITAMAQDRLGYIRADLGYMFWQESEGSVSSFGKTDLDGDESLSIRLGVGMEVKEGYRVEVTWQHIAEIDLEGVLQISPFEGSVTTNLLMVNGYADLGKLCGAKDSAINPYIGVGIGIAFHDVDDFQTVSGRTRVDGDSSSDFAWQISLGLQWQIKDNIKLDFAYMHIDAGIGLTKDTIRSPAYTGTIFDPAEFDVRFQGIMIGLNWGF